MENQPSILKTGKYTIEFGNAGTAVYTVDEAGEREWIATVADPSIATEVVEGLILVEQKRFYHPEAAPTFDTVLNGQVFTQAKKSPSPPFLKTKGQAL